MGAFVRDIMLDQASLCVRVIGCVIVCGAQGPVCCSFGAGLGGGYAGGCQFGPGAYRKAIRARLPRSSCCLLSAAPVIPT